MCCLLTVMMTRHTLEGRHTTTTDRNPKNLAIITEKNYPYNIVRESERKRETYAHICSQDHSVIVAQPCCLCTVLYVVVLSDGRRLLLLLFNARTDHHKYTRSFCVCIVSGILYTHLSVLVQFTRPPLLFEEEDVSLVTALVKTTTFTSRSSFTPSLKCLTTIDLRTIFYLLLCVCPCTLIVNKNFIFRFALFA